MCNVRLDICNVRLDICNVRFEYVLCCPTSFYKIYILPFFLQISVNYTVFLQVFIRCTV